jgi:hypothetical protein
MGTPFRIPVLRAARWPLVLVATQVAPSAAAAPAVEWNPARTWVFAIACTEWKFDRALKAPKKGRLDLAFVEALKARGVPADQVVLLKDRQGTIAAINKQFPDLLKKTRKDDTLVFYFQGHGGRDVEGQTNRYYFVNYDADDADDQNTYLFVDAVYEMIEAHFNGSHAVMLADCCSSGGLVAEATRRAASKRKFTTAYACLASVYAHNSSTGWTFTRDLIKGFRGDPIADHDDDGAVTLGELITLIDADTAYVEEQKAQFAVFNGFDLGTRIAAAGKKSHPDVGKYVEARQGGDWYVAQVLDVKDNKYQVAYAGFEEREWVTSRRVRDFTPKQFPEGTRVVARDDDDKWHPATVKRAVHNMHFVHFDHDKSTNGVLDEWVGPERIKPRK